MNLLLLHGNGGANSRFRLVAELHLERGDRSKTLHLPLLPGFEGRPLVRDKKDEWRPFLEALAHVVSKEAEQEWVFYGHGIGGSILLEWAARNWQYAPEGFQPKQIVLHAPIGASLEHRFFPKLMKPKPVRKLIHWMIYQPWLRKRWKKKLFLHPERIPRDLIVRFFVDYKNCEAFPLFFDLITPSWYRKVQSKLKDQKFYFLWGEKERVVASQYLDYWRRDFPKSDFEIVPGFLLFDSITGVL